MRSPVYKPSRCFHADSGWYARNALVTSCLARVSSGISSPGYCFTHSLTSYTFPGLRSTDPLASCASGAPPT
ncbi:hypothetical protein NL676_020681 [Syzygium grande]|nr:hypothetical protein NL676_020681 [Syzygium grande]